MRLRVRDLGFSGAALFAMIFFASSRLRAATVIVDSTGDSIAVDSSVTLREAIESINNGADTNADVTANRAGAYGTNDQIIFLYGSLPQQIPITTAYPAIAVDMKIIGPTTSSDLEIFQLQNERIFFVNAGVTFSISDVTLRGGRSEGGEGGYGALSGGGGGGAAGMGGAIFVNTGATANVTGVRFFEDTATGGEGGGTGGSNQAGGGGGGFDGNDGQAAVDDQGGDGGDGGDLGGTGGAGSGSGAGGNATGDGAGGGGGGGTGSANGGAGGFAGGGGGQAVVGIGGPGGFGAGGGGRNGVGGAFGGNGAIPQPAGCNGAGTGGGGGAGLGGAIFVRDGATLNVSQCDFDSNDAHRGAGGIGDCSTGSDGQGRGGAIFAMDDATVNEDCGNTFENNTADDGDNDIYYTGTITFGDTTNPVITCPPDQLAVPNTTGLCSAVVDPGKATATDNCGVASIKGVRSDALPLTDPYPVGATFITWTATDTSGNTAECLQTITVKDTENPALVCAGNQTASADATCQAAVPNFVVSATDNCPGLVVVQVPPAGTLVGKGDTSVTVTATDAAGNTASCNPTFTVNDTTPPVVTSSTVIHILSSDHTMKDVIFSASAVDNCDGVLTPTVQIYSNENEEVKTSSGDARTSPDARGIGTGYDQNPGDKWYGKLALRQERTNNGQGRVYLIKVSATDLSGNTGYSCSYVISPKSSKRRDVQTAQNLGDAVVGPCSASGLVPLNYLLNPIGFGPVIGSKQ